MSTTQTKKTGAYIIGSSSLLKAMSRIDEPGPMNPHAEILYWKKIREDRGYDYFSADSMEDWHSVYGQQKVTQEDIQAKANHDLETFLIEAKTPGHPNHDNSRIMFHTSFQGNDQLARDYFYQKSKNVLGGEFLRPFRNLSYEAIVLKAGTISTAHIGFEHQTMKNLFLAKWSAIGYYRDQEYRTRYLDEYCVAFKGHLTETELKAFNGK